MAPPLILVPSVPGQDWIREALPWATPAELLMAGKRFIDYSHLLRCLKTSVITRYRHSDCSWLNRCHPPKEAIDRQNRFI